MGNEKKTSQSHVKSWKLIVVCGACVALAAFKFELMG